MRHQWIMKTQCLTGMFTVNRSGTIHGLISSLKLIAKRSDHMPSGKRWSKSEDEILALGIEEGASYEEIGKVVDRTHKACALRAFALRKKSQKNATRYSARGGKNAGKTLQTKVARRNTTVSTHKPVPSPQPPSDGRYIPVVESGAVNASLNRLFMVSVASMLFSVSTFVLISVVLLAG